MKKFDFKIPSVSGICRFISNQLNTLRIKKMSLISTLNCPMKFLPYITLPDLNYVITHDLKKGCLLEGRV